MGIVAVFDLLGGDLMRTEGGAGLKGQGLATTRLSSSNQFWTSTSSAEVPASAAFPTSWHCQVEGQLPNRLFFMNVGPDQMMTPQDISGGAYVRRNRHGRSLSSELHRLALLPQEFGSGGPIHDREVHNNRKEGNMPHPGPALRFEVRWGEATLGFSEVSGLNFEHQMIEYRDGLSKEHRFKQPGIPKYGNITLKCGVLNGDNELYVRLRERDLDRTGHRDLTITLVDEEKNPVSLGARHVPNLFRLTMPGRPLLSRRPAVGPSTR